MLTQEDKDKIIEMRKQGYSLQAIHDKLGFAIETIRKVLREDEEKKTKKLDKGGNKRAGEDHNFSDVVSLDSTEEGVREFLVNIGNLIKKGQLKESFRKELEKYYEELQNLLKVEVDDRIAAERADAVATRDEEWNKSLEQYYVKKEVATDLENTIKAKDATIEHLRNEIAKKDTKITNNQDEKVHLKNSHQIEIENLKSQITGLYWQNQDLINENWNMHNIMQGYQYYYDQGEQEYQKRERELSNEKTTFNKERKEQEVKSDKAFFEAEKKYNEIERREEQQTEQAVKLKKREDEFNMQIKNVYDELNKKITSVENREKKVNESANELLTQKKQLDTEKKKIDDYKESQMNEINQFKEKQMEEIKIEKEEIEKTKGELKVWEQRLRKMERTLKKIFGYYGYSNLYKSFSNNNQVGKKDQKTKKDKKYVELHPV